MLIRALLELRGGVGLVTVTAPGVEAGVVWDRSKCTHGPEERCSGPKGCRVVDEVAQRWNVVMQDNWPALHRAASARARRRTGNGPIVAAKAWEAQERGVNHLHLVVPMSDPVSKTRARAYVQAVKELAPRYGFGYADLQATFTGEGAGGRAALYVAKYVGKATSESLVIRRPIYVGRFLTAITGVTMRVLRWRRWIHRKWRFTPGLDELPSLVALLRCFPTMEYLGLATAAPARAP